MLGGVDVLVFTGGVGEHLPEVRRGRVRDVGDLRDRVRGGAEDAEIARQVRAADPRRPGTRAEAAARGTLVPRHGDA